MLAPPVNAGYDPHDTRHFQHYTEQLLALQPNDPDLLLSLAGPWDANGSCAWNWRANTQRRGRWEWLTQRRPG